MNIKFLTTILTITLINITLFSRPVLASQIRVINNTDSDLQINYQLVTVFNEIQNRDIIVPANDTKQRDPVVEWTWKFTGHINVGRDISGSDVIGGNVCTASEASSEKKKYFATVFVFKSDGVTKCTYTFTNK